MCRRGNLRLIIGVTLSSPGLRPRSPTGLRLVCHSLPLLKELWLPAKLDKRGTESPICGGVTIGTLREESKAHPQHLLSVAVII
jgi:hypothetical protein